MPANLKLSTTGVNYEPGSLDLTTASTAHVDFNVTVDLQGHAITLRNGEHFDDVHIFACIKSPTYCATLSEFELDSESGELVRSLVIGRFSQAGRVLESPVGPFTWLVTMEQGRNLLGVLRVGVGPQGEPSFPGEMTLAGRMTIMVRLDDAPAPITLRSRRESIQTGETGQWPPHGSTLRMQGDPVEYFEESQMAEPDAAPFLSVQAATVKLLSPCNFLATVPTISDVTALDADGFVWSQGEVRAARVSWSESGDLVDENGDPVLFEQYRIYRKPTDGDLNSWRLIGVVPRTQDYFIDTEFDGEHSVSYTVTRGMVMPFGYVHEGLFDSPASIGSLV